MRAAYTSWQSYSPDRVPGLGGALKQRQLKKRKEQKEDWDETRDSRPKNGRAENTRQEGT